MFTNILNESTASLSIMDGSICTIVSLILGIWIALVYATSGDTSKHFKTSLMIMPALVQMVIMMVNGNLGTGVAALGAFSLVRFRSVPGSSREILFIFFAMAIGLATGMGYLSFACFISFVIGVMAFIVYRLPMSNSALARKNLHITVPENLDYTQIFDDIFSQYLKQVELIKVKTVHLGSMFEICYQITLKDVKQEKAMIDAIRTRNGNLNVVVSRRQAMSDAL